MIRASLSSKPQASSALSNCMIVHPLLFCLQPEFDQAADGFGAAGLIFLLACPVVNLINEVVR
jgi:hypothetical protein